MLIIDMAYNINLFFYSSNYFYGPHIVYGKNGKTISAPEQKVYEQFYTYKIEWYDMNIYSIYMALTFDN